MDSIKEALVINFYTHKLHVDDTCNCECPSDGMMELCEDIFSCLLDVECEDIIRVIKEIGQLFEISHGDVPQFSSLEASVYKVPFLVKDCGIEALSYTQLGFMLRTKPRKEGADMKYGENQSKTAAQMGLCSIKNPEARTQLPGSDRYMQTKIKPIFPRDTYTYSTFPSSRTTC